MHQLYFCEALSPFREFLTINDLEYNKYYQIKTIFKSYIERSLRTIVIFRESNSEEGIYPYEMALPRDFETPQKYNKACRLLMERSGEFFFQLCSCGELVYTEIEREE